MPDTIFPYLRWQSVFDFAVLTAAFYLVLRWARTARALRLSLVILGLQAVSLLARQYDLYITGWILQTAAVLMSVVLLVVFQSEWRRAFMRLDSALLLWPEPAAVFHSTFRAAAKACFEMASKRTGALIVFLQKNPIDELITAAIPIGAGVSAELLIALFQKNSPLHDGAVIIEHDRIADANAVLPLTQREDVPGYYGTRHRAAMGLAERSDAVVVAVSEERGTVTLMKRRGILRVASPEELIAELQASVVRPAPEKRRLGRHIFSNWRLKLISAGLAALVWSLSFLAAGTTVRNVNCGIEFVNVPRGLDIHDLSTDTLDVQLRGTPWVMNSMGLTRLTARFSLSGSAAGLRALPVAKGILNLPPGVRVERITPPRVTIRLVPRGG